jgi:hypothetical protein
MPLPERSFFHLRLKSFQARGAGLIPVLTAVIEVNASSSGGSESVQIVNRGAKTVFFNLLHLDSTLYWASAESRGKIPSALPFLAVGRARSLRMPTLELDARYSVELELDFPLSPSVLSEIEELRAGGEPSFVVLVRLSGLARYEIPPETAPPGNTPYLIPFVAEDLQVTHHETRSHFLAVEKSRWIEKILPDLGFGRWMIYEVPIENFDGAAQVDVYLENAVRQFLAGEYKLSVAASRDVVETLERELVPRPPTVCGA